jgi:hypothetical protein
VTDARPFMYRDCRYLRLMHGYDGVDELAKLMLVAQWCSPR